VARPRSLERPIEVLAHSPLTCVAGYGDSADNTNKGGA
jgi:hypothetical protein